ncbi:Fe(2+) transporter [Podospora pseudocomata]|uniref:Fe(2+) transporter n=3 Tax=Podospora TaxID=5144 RepID=A0ABR0GBM8_9PEZI|nr:Fe(2+) transporter [Podospora bellae-mahoneyi]KAK4653150.1 Fe(2+) transporter [Podospora pseudocomata]KAK4675585.1 Fe(2+) transporter [Podospora pseudoanserina]
MAQPNVVPEEDYDYEALPPNFSLLQNMAAGAFAGIAEHCAMYPIDAVKVSRAPPLSTWYRDFDL